MSALQRMLDAQGGASAPASRSRGGSGSSGSNGSSGGSGSSGNSGSTGRWSDGRNQSSSRWGDKQRSSAPQGNASSGGDGWQNVSDPKKNRHSSGQDARNNSGKGGRSSGFSQKDRIYTALRDDIQRRAREKQSTFLLNAAKEGSGGAETALEKAFELEVLNLQSWVGELSHEGQCTYFQDRGKKYPFYCSESGHALLIRLLEHNAKLLKINIALCLQHGDPQFIMAEGELIYEIKPTLKAYGSTWSQEEYGHPGLQRTYIKLKSFQRFTETWATLERAAADGLFDVHRPDYQGDDADEFKGHPIKIASIGGGPGYELLATKLFFDQFAPGVELELVSLDLCPSWRQYVEGLGFTFYHWDIRDGKLLETMQLVPGDLTYVIISYVLIYCSDDPTMDMLADLVTEGGVRAIIVSERSESTAGCSMMESRNIHVAKLMDQSMGRDERQCIYVSDPTMLRSANGGGGGEMEQEEFVPVFPNVPFSEHKQARQDGGHRLGWRPWHDDK